MFAQANDCFNCKKKALLDQILLAEGPFYDAFLAYLEYYDWRTINWMADFGILAAENWTDFTNRIHNYPTHDIVNFDNRAGMAQNIYSRAAVWKFYTINQSRRITSWFKEQSYKRLCKIKLIRFDIQIRCITLWFKEQPHKILR